MQKKSVALVACSNGYGHIKRLLFLAESLFMAGANPTLFADRSSAELIAKKEQILIKQKNAFFFIKVF